MKPSPTILRRNPFIIALPPAVAPVKQRLEHSKFDRAMGTLQLRTQGLMNYLSYIVQKAW